MEELLQVLLEQMEQAFQLEIHLLAVEVVLDLVLSQEMEEQEVMEVFMEEVEAAEVAL
jgi:hypothetical protein